MPCHAAVRTSEPIHIWRLLNRLVEDEALPSRREAQATRCICPGLQYIQSSRLGSVEASARVERSADLIHWADWKSITLDPQPVEIIDPDWSSVPYRFYRVIAP